MNKSNKSLLDNPPKNQPETTHTNTPDIPSNQIIRMPSSKGSVITKPGDSAIECDSNVGQSEGLLEIANEILNIVTNDLNTIDSQSMLQNFMQIINSIEEDMAKTFEKSKCIPKIQEVFKNYFEIIMNFFVRCLQYTDNVKASTVDNLNDCLIQFLQITNFEISKKNQNTAEVNNLLTYNFTEEEEFVVQINSLSSAIKELMKNTWSCIKSVNNSTELSMEQLLQCRNCASDISAQCTFTQTGKSSQKLIKEKTETLLGKIDMVSEIRKEISNSIKSIDGYSKKFYQEAKEIFKKLKSLHAEKLAEIQKRNILNVTNNQNNAPSKYPRKVTSVSPSRKKLNTSYVVGTTNTSSSNAVNLSTAHSGTKQYSRNINAEKKRKCLEGDSENTDKSSNYTLSRSTEHFNSAKIKNKMLSMNNARVKKSQMKVNKLQIQKINPNANANVNANLTNSSVDMTIPSNVSITAIAPNTTILSIKDKAHEEEKESLIAQINDLTTRNRELLQEIAKLHDTYVHKHYENEFLKKENSELKAGSAQSLEVEQDVGTQFDKRNDSNIFSRGKKSKSVAKISIGPHAHGSVNNNIKHIPHYSRGNTPKATRTAKSPMRITETGNLFKLAETVISFIRQMSILQEAICKKSSNILDLKRAFEMQKKEIIQMANDISEYNSSNILTPEYTIANEPAVVIEDKAQGCEIPPQINIGEQNNSTGTSNNPILIKDNENLRIEREENIKTISQLNEEIARLNELRGKVKSDYDSLISKNISEFEKEKEKTEKLIEMNKNLESVIKNLGEELIEKKNEIIKMKEDFDREIQKEKEINLKHSVPMIGAAKQKDYENKISQYKKEVEKFKQTSSEIEKENGKMKEKIHEYVKDIEILKTSVIERDKRISEVEIEFVNLKKREERARVELKEKEGKIATLENEVTKLNTDAICQKDKAEISTLIAEKENLVVQLSKLSSEKNALIEKVKALSMKEEEIAELKKGIENKDNLANEYKKLLETLAQSKENDTKKYEEIIVKKEADITDLKSQLSKQRDQLVYIKDSYEKDTLTLKGKIDLIIKENSEFKDKIKSKDKDVSKLQSEIQTLTQENDGKLNKISQQVLEKDKEIISLNNRLKENKAEIQELNTLLEDLHNGKKNESIDYQAKINTLTEDKSNEIKNLKNQLDVLNHKASTEIKKLNEELFKVSQSKEVEIKNLNKQFEKVLQEKEINIKDLKQQIVLLEVTQKEEAKEKEKEIDQLHVQRNMKALQEEEIQEKIQSKDNEIKQLLERLENEKSKHLQILDIESIQKDMTELASMIENIHSILLEKKKQLSHGQCTITKEVKREYELNEAMVLEEDIFEIKDEGSEIYLGSHSPSPVLQSHTQYNEILQMLDFMLNHIEKTKLAGAKQTHDKQRRSNSEDIEALQEENRKLKILFNECIQSIFEAINLTRPQVVEDDHESISLNIGTTAGGNNLMLLDSKSSKASNPITLTPSNIQDGDFIRNAVEMFKKYNHEMNEAKNKIEQEKGELMEEMHKYKLMAETYKQTLEDAMQKIHSAADEPKNCKAHAFTVEDLIDNNKEEKVILQTDEVEELIAANAELQNKLLEKEEEAIKNRDTISRLIKINSGTTIASFTTVVPQEKFDLLIKQYISEQERCALLEKKLANFLSQQQATNEKENTLLKQNGRKANKREPTLGNNESIPSQSSETDGVEEKIKIKLKKKGEPNYLAMLNQGFTESAVKTQQSGMSGSNMKNDSNYQEILHEKKDLEEKEEMLLQQLQTIKVELKETRENFRRAKEENEVLRKKVSEPRARIDGINTEINGVLQNALEKLIAEIALTSKIKEFLTVIMRVVGYTDEQIFAIYQAKEKKKGIFNIFK